MQKPTGLSELQIEAVNRASRRFAFTEVERVTFIDRLVKSTYEHRELILCGADPQYFIVTHCKIYDATVADWIDFELWNEQIDALNMLHDNQRTVALKARQLGLTWLALAYALWLMLFRPIASILLFSKRDDEAIYLLSKERLRGMYDKLPDWMKARSTVDDSAHMLSLSNGSNCRAFPTSAGDSYTASYVVIDECDLVPNLNMMMRSIKPTIDGGGKLFLISRVDKSRPESEFKRIYRGAKAGTNGWAGIFLPWHVRPERDQAWYEDQKRDILDRTGGLDDLHEQYPATDVEALAPASKDKRIPVEWLKQCYQEETPIPLDEIPYNSHHPVPLIDGLKIFRLPKQHGMYLAGADCAEGLPTSDDSVSQFIDVRTGEQVAVLAGKFTPAVHAAYTARIAQYFNSAKIVPENNNHGHAFILWLRENRFSHLLLSGHDGKDGWSSNTLGKVLMYDAASQGAKDKTFIIHDVTTKDQLLSIEKSTLRAPEGQHDDYADAWAIAEAMRGSAVTASDVGLRQARVKGR